MTSAHGDTQHAAPAGRVALTPRSYTAQTPLWPNTSCRAGGGAVKTRVMGRWLRVQRAACSPPCLRPPEAPPPVPAAAGGRVGARCPRTVAGPKTVAGWPVACAPQPGDCCHTASGIPTPAPAALLMTQRFAYAEARASARTCASLKPFPAGASRWRDGTDTGGWCDQPV